MALTATATKSLREQIEHLLGMVDHVTIVRFPDKPNLRFSCIEVSKDNYDATFALILRDLKSKRKLMPRIIIFC
jgi:ATP-dependent DNA helicase RecQ